MIDDNEIPFYASLILGLLVLVGLGVACHVHEENQWNDWAAKHCKKSGVISGSWVWSKHVGYVEGKTCWQCDDGLEHCR